jgi:cell fate (sporulation/competence/biofilm development) regulator YlbF (YheA/YmcA/DUF963 family)
MQTTTEQSTIIQKTRELCQTIVEHPDFLSIRQRVDIFMENEEAKLQYQALSERGEFLQHKQQQGVALTNEEIDAFEKQREVFFSNPVARGFIDAQQEMSQVQESVVKYLAKTYELGRLPEEEDMSGSCGTGCGCH